MPQEGTMRAKQALLCACAIAHLGSSLAQPIPAPWRRDDAILISVCFDGLGKDAPATLRALEVTDISVGTARFELIGHTTTDRPMYMASFAHPLRFRAVLVDLPGGGVAQFDRPAKLEVSIEGWVDSMAELQCVSGDTFSAAQATLTGAKVPTTACPDLGAKISYRVDNGPGFSSRRVLERQRGLTTLNGLRGCRELIYKK
jgi:hypothetical protein